MTSWTIFSLLCLDCLIIHMHVIFYRGHILMPQQLLETEGIIAQDEVANGKSMAKNVGTDTLVGDPCPFAQTSEELRHTVSR